MTGAAPSKSAVATTALSRRFGSVHALDGVDLCVAAGESLALFGANGAGKTTLIRILGLGLAPGGGSFSINGLDPRKDERRIRGQLGLVSHASFLYGDLSARENLEFFARLYGVEDPRGRALALLDRAGLAHRAEDRVSTLSRGMQQRVAVARALVHDPPVVLLDEPFTGLDPQAATGLAATLSELRRDGRTLLLATHDLRQGLELTDRWVLLSRGRVAAQGLSAATPPEELEAAYRRLSA